MPKANDLVGRQDMGGKHGGQARSSQQTKPGRNMSAGKIGAMTRPAIRSRPDGTQARLGKRVELR